MAKPKNNQLSSIFDGVWKSRYTYRNTIRKKIMVSEHYVRFYHRRGGVILESIPYFNITYLVARMSLDGRVMTGTWQESTSPSGDYKGEIFQGAAQLIRSKDDKSFLGMRLGYGRPMVVKSGKWEVIYIGQDERSLRNLDKAAGK